MSSISTPHLSYEVERWRKYLRKDPTRFLLDADANPSVYLWYLLDVAKRPENSVAVHEARERVLYSNPVQDIFAAQQPEGYWERPESLSEPRYRGTLWNLALLAELGIPRESRRARAACEFALQNFLEENGGLNGLSAVETGYLIHALGYFNLARDARVLRAARALTALTEQINSHGVHTAPTLAMTIDAKVAALWAWGDLLDDMEISDTASHVCEHVLDSLTTRAAPPDHFAPITFPPFDSRDELFILRVLALYDRVTDPRAASLVEHVMAKQNESSLWSLEKSLNGSLATTVEEVNAPSRWATLNALRVIVKLVLSPA